MTSRPEPILAAEVLGYPVFVYALERPEGVVLVDTGMIDSTPELDAEYGPVPHPLPEELVRRVVAVVNTHLDFDHCGGNRLFPGVPIHVQARERADADTIAEWVDFPGAAYVEHVGEGEVVPGVRVVPAPGHTTGHQIVVVDDTYVLAGDVAYSFRELGFGATEGQRLVLDLGLETWLSHVERSHVPRRTPAAPA